MTTEASTDKSALLSTYKRRQQLGWYVALGLLILTILEFIVSTSLESPLLWLTPFIVAKGALILEYFMHFSDLYNSEEH